jgi:hypothetical protein
VVKLAPFGVTILNLDIRLSRFDPSVLVPASTLPGRLACPSRKRKH